MLFNTFMKQTHCLIQALMDFIYNNNNNTLVNDNTKLLRWSIFLNIHYTSLTNYDLPFPPKWGFHMPARYANGHISATGDPIHFMFGSRIGFSWSADRIWRYFRLHQIQVGGRPPSWIISNGHISATAHSIR